MNTHADKTSENKSQAVSQTILPKQAGDESVFQLADNRPETTLQRKIQALADNRPQVQQLKNVQAMADRYTSSSTPPIQAKANDTGLPDNLKSGIENLSGHSLDDVKVHYNSDKPQQVNAHAYAQGTDIHLASGQEKHLPHEAWHVVQQKQGRVKPTRQLKGSAINDDHSLEAEADHMGTKALQAVFDTSKENSCCCGNCQSQNLSEHVAAPIQAKPVIQRARFLSNQQVRTLEGVIERAIDGLVDNGDADTAEYRVLTRAFNSFDHGSNSEGVMQGIMNSTTGSTNQYVVALRTQIAQMILTNGQNIRANNYPSSYDAVANGARNTFQNARLLPNSEWTCPGNGGNRAAHATTNSDITIDHIIPCAAHWNGVGYNTDWATRRNWYNDPSNHRYMCRSCNSSLGSGGITYRMDTGPTYNRY